MAVAQSVPFIELLIMGVLCFGWSDSFQTDKWVSLKSRNPIPDN